MIIKEDGSFYFGSNIKLSKAHNEILMAKPGRAENFSKHLVRGGKVETYYPFIFGDGYADFIKTKKRYRVVKGSRGSKKTVTVCRDYILKMMQNPEANLMVIRKVQRTHKDSTFSELKKAIRFLGVEDKWKWTTTPLEIEYLPTGQKILFRGMDDPLKITGVTVDVGELCWVWFEEAYELETEEEFEFVDESIRGILPDGLYYQLTLTLNPWNKNHWIKRRFFDPVYGEKEDQFNDVNDIFAITTNFLINEFIDDNFKQNMEKLKVRNPGRYQVAGLGHWGVSSGVIYDDWVAENFDYRAVMANKSFRHIRGLDFGFTQDPTGFVGASVDLKNMLIYVYDEIYKKNMSNTNIAQKIAYMGYGKDRITADSAEPKSIEQLYKLGIRKIEPARKGQDSVDYGIQKIKDFKIIVHKTRCPNFITEIENYAWDPDKINTPIDKFNHLMDALRYAMEQLLYVPTGVAVPIGVMRL